MLSQSACGPVKADKLKEQAGKSQRVTEEMMESLFEKLSCCPGAAARIHMMLEAGGFDVIHKEPASGDSKNAAEVLQEI